jgi:hypothetical protein
MEKSEVNEMEMKWTTSSASCKLKNIKGIMFGGISSRFWMLRKHVNSLSKNDLKWGKVPFYSWECITINMENRDISKKLIVLIDLVIKNEEDMMKLIALITNEI